MAESLESREAIVERFVDRRRPEYMTMREVARTLGVHYNTIRRLSSADLPFYRIGSRGDRRYRIADVEDYLAARRVG